jgi:competence protein ComEC
VAPVTRVTPWGWAAQAVEAQRGHLFVWSPVALAAGIGGYFALAREPAVALLALAGGGAAALAVVAWRITPRAAPFVLAAALVLAGLCLAGLRAHWVAAPVLGFRYYGPVEGRIVAIDRSASDAPRLTLDRVVLDRMDPDRTPRRVRVSLHGPQDWVRPEPGLTVILTANLAPPAGPVEPGGFDFRRLAWFRGLGAVGYTRTPVLALAPAGDGATGLGIHRLRMRISAAVQAALPGEAGAFAAAVTTGDRSAMGRATLEALRGSNLAHLLAISGLHMGLLTGCVFAVLRLALAAVPALALRWPIKKIAAAGALLAAGFYYLLSGGNVATERAMIMISVMLAGVLLDRRAITLRAVAIAALLVLALRPETLAEPGFQMSFAATTALVAVFGALRAHPLPRLPRWARPALALLISSAVAGAATAPVAAAHFNRIADYGLIANLASVPLMASVVMPGAVLAAALWPLGLAHWGLALMRPAIEWILWVAHRVSGLEGAVTPVVAPAPGVLPLMAAGMLLVILWQGRLRWAGLAPVAAALLLWAGTERPPVLVSESGGLLGVLTPEGRALSKPRGEGFVALNWLENDGDGAAQDRAAARPGAAQWVEIGGARLLHVTGRGAAARAAEGCGAAALVVTSAKLESPPAGPCEMLDAAKLRETGAMAIWPVPDGLRLEGARDRQRRLWSP